MLAPAGYVPHRSGLVVPEGASRVRQVWPDTEFRAFDRAMKLAEAHNVEWRLRCGQPDCPDRAMERIQGVDGGYTLRCGCTDRVFTRAI